ncbi:hypothetical protein BJX70DRAFT_395395 [Aspergillus crustosus]
MEQKGVLALKDIFAGLYNCRSFEIMTTGANNKFALPNALRPGDVLTILLGLRLSGVSIAVVPKEPDHAWTDSPSYHAFLGFNQRLFTSSAFSTAWHNIEALSFTDVATNTGRHQGYILRIIKASKKLRSLHLTFGSFTPSVENIIRSLSASGSSQLGDLHLETGILGPCEQSLELFIIPHSKTLQRLYLGHLSLNTLNGGWTNILQTIANHCSALEAFRVIYLKEDYFGDLSVLHFPRLKFHFFVDADAQTNFLYCVSSIKRPDGKNAISGATYMGPKMKTAVRRLIEMAELGTWQTVFYYH